MATAVNIKTETCVLPCTPDTIVAYYIVERLMRSRTLSAADFSYMKGRWYIYDKIMRAKTPAELVLKMDIMRTAPEYSIVDYIAIAFCCATAETVSDAESVFIRTIDETDMLDKIVVMPKFVKCMAKACSETSLIIDNFSVCRLMAHVISKFPDLRRLGFMTIRHKGGRTEQRFPDDFLRRYF